MKCEECEYRFICFTVKNRPHRIKINWKITDSCSRCLYADFSAAYSNHTKKTVTLCKLRNYLVHLKSSCDKFETKNVKDIDKVYAELREEMGKKNRGSKLPKYCELEDDESVDEG